MKRSFYFGSILCAVLPQLLLALFAPALVVCQEASGEQSLELSFAPCCGDDVGPAGASPTGGVRSSAEDCGGCEDASFVVALQREDEQRVTAPLLPSALALKLVSPTYARAALPLRVASTGPPCAPRLAALRTVVLRC